MSDFWVCSDNIDGNENSRINDVCQALKKNGHTATNGGVGPNTVQSHGLSNASKGQIGVFIVGGSDAGMYVDFRDGLKRSYYHYKYMWVVFASETATTDTWITCNGLANTALVRAHDDNYSGSNIESVGKSAKSYFDANKQYIGYACGKKGCSFNDVIQNFIKAIGGDTSSSKSSSGSSIKNAIKEVLYGWNGDVECYLRDDTIYINKIRDPTSAKLQLIEDVNVFLEGVSIKDIDPNTPNKLIVKWSNNQYIIKDDERIKRFGEVTKTITSSNKSEKDAIAFAYHEWNKLLKDSGRQLECKIDGGPEWRIGKWVRVYIPTFNLNGYMYLTKVSHDDDTNWKTNVTLTDYPPDLGTKPSKTTNDNNDSTSSDDSNES